MLANGVRTCLLALHPSRMLDFAMTGRVALKALLLSPMNMLQTPELPFANSMAPMQKDNQFVSAYSRFQDGTTLSIGLKIQKAFSTELRLHVLVDEVIVRWMKWKMIEDRGVRDVVSRETEEVIRPDLRPRISTVMFQDSATVEVRVIVEEEDLVRDGIVLPKMSRGISWSMGGRGRLQRNLMQKWMIIGAVPRPKERLLLQQHSSPRVGMISI